MNIKKILTLTLACSILAATPIMAAPVDGNPGGEETIQYTDLDPKLTEAAEKAIEQYANGKAFKLEEAFKNDYYEGKTKKESWIVQSKDRNVVVSLDAVSGKVLTVSLTFTIPEVTGDYANYLKAAQAAAKQLYPKTELAFTKAHYFKSNKAGLQEATMTFASEDRQFIAMDTNTLKPTMYSLKFKAADVDRKIVAEAEKAVKSMGVKVQPFTDIERRKTNGETGEDAWVLTRKVGVKGDFPKKRVVIQEDNRAFVVDAIAIVEGKTGKLISVTIERASDNQKLKKLTEKEGITLVKPVAKQLFGADLSSYTLKVDKDWGDYVFTSKGKESIIAKFDSYGNLVRMERKK
ncbi:hypothetical protein [Paenibacillus azoreducens]|uniref:PepSY domain-containing protein n=1 Tax=Paenibacillus azoreducens TaxID=116718 RepID=A0A919YBU4_9BACL|nr:hypothetical protein [Paenibacillus azoreducens]GIO48741.1 hypothetical protein J34TS1_35060 [Paenibacillus azoreducens]